MASLKAELSVKLDASSLASTFLSNIGGPLGSLSGISSPVTPGQLSDLGARLSSLDATSLQGGLGTLLEQAGSLTGGLPIAGSVMAPLTGTLTLLRTALQDPGLGRLDERIKVLVRDAGSLLEGGREQGFLGVLHTLATTLTGAGEGRVVLDLVNRLAGGGVSLPSLPFTDAIAAADGAVRVLGGLMVLESVISDVVRLTEVAAQRIDVAALERQLDALEAALTLDGVELADAVAAVNPLDAVQVAVVVAAVANCGAILETVRDEFAAAMGLGEATLAYLDFDRVLLLLDGARTLLRTGDLVPLRRVSEQAAGAIQPFLRQDLLSGPAQQLDGLVATVEAQVAALAGRISAFDVTQLTAPLADGIGILLRPLEQVNDVLSQIRIAYQGALEQVRQGVAALPVQALADAIREILEPIAEVIGAIEALVADIMGALQAAAAATTTTLGQIEGHVDTLASSVDALFADAKAALDGFNVDGALGTVEEEVRRLSTLLEQARMDPAFDAASDAIDTAADAIAAVPFSLLPESMKAEVDEAVRPIKEANARALETEIEDLLQITEDGRFAARAELDEAIASLQAAYEALLAEVRKYDPREALAEVDDKLDEVAEQVRTISPAITLADVRAAIDQVKQAIADIDVDAPLQPVRDAFATIIATVEQFRPSALVGDVQAQLDEVRAAITEQIRLDDISEALDSIHQKATDLFAQYDPARLTTQLESALGELQQLVASTGSVSAMDGVGTAVAGLLGGMGLHVYPAAFAAVTTYLQGASGTAALEQRAGRAAEAIVRTRADVAALDFTGRAAALAARVARVQSASLTLAAALPADGSATVRLQNVSVRLDGPGVFAGLDGNRRRYLGALAAVTAKVETLRRVGFSEVDVRVGDLRTAISPFAPLRDWLRRLLGQLGLSGFELGLAGVLNRVFEIVPPARLIGLVLPFFDALRNRVEALLASVLAPLQSGIATIRDLIGVLDLGPLLDALDAVHAEVLDQITALSPDALLGESVNAVKSLQTTLAQADPLAPVEAILTAVRDTVARVLEKLSFERLLATPLAIYDQILAALDRLDVAKLLAPLLDTLDTIAHGVDTGLDHTVEAFERLQAALPGGGGGSSAEVSVGVSVGV